MLWQRDETQIPLHVYGDILLFLPPTVRRQVRQFVKQNPKPSAQVVFNAIMRCTPCDSAWCLRHGRVCRSPVCEIETGGTPCQDFSALNQARAGLDGSRNVFYWTWVRLRRHRQELCWLHENVIAFGAKTLQDDLGDLYVIVMVVVCPTMLGWSSRRKRQFSVGIHKRILPLPMCTFLGELYSLETLEAFIRVVFFRRCCFSHDSYLLDDPLIADELYNERVWAFNRGRNHPDVTTPADARAGDDVPSVFVECLNASERARLLEYERMYPGPG
jgi:hypothetical protein